MSTGITALVNSGLDAFSNLWDVELNILTTSALGVQMLTKSPSIANNPYWVSNIKLSVRADQPAIPELILGSYPVEYKGAKLTKFNAEIVGKREITLKIRLDGDYAAYNYLLAMKHAIANPQTSASGAKDMDINFQTLATSTTAGNIGGTLRLYPYNAKLELGTMDSSTTIIPGSWEFSDVLCIHTGVPAYDRDGSTPISVDAKFIFGKMVEFREYGTITSV